MPDTLSSSNELKIDNLFVDGDTRTITLKNPKDTITPQEIIALNAQMQSSQIIVGDKWGGAFGRITSVKKVTKETKKLDLT